MESYRKPIAVAAFVSLVFIGVMIIALPNFDTLSAVQSSLTVLLVGLFLGRGDVWKRPRKLLIAPIVAAMFALPFVMLARSFGGVDVLSLVFHAQFGVDGATFDGLGRQIVESISVVTLIVFGAYALANLTAWKRTCYLGVAIALLIFNPLSRYVLEYGTPNVVASDLHLQLKEAQVTAPNVMPDIVIVYLEGLERSYGDRELFGDIYAPLEDYETLGVSFTSVRETRGTGWSLAGLVATQCGVPLMPNGLRNYYRFESQIDFMTSRTCLGDLTTGFGYKNNFVVGGAESFGGFNHFFASHAVDNVVDLEALQAIYPTDVIDAALVGWILDDQLVFDAALKIYDEQAKEDDPILLMIETYGAHGNTAILSRNCTDDQTAVLAPDVKSAVVCNLQNLVSFVDRLKENRRNRPTVVVIASDHLNRDVRMAELFRTSERSNTVIMFSLGGDAPLVPPGTKIDRPASMTDVYPSILAYAGFASSDAEAGLGRSLFGTAQTLMEEKGLRQLNAELFPNPLLSAGIWAGSAH